MVEQKYRLWRYKEPPEVPGVIDTRVCRLSDPSSCVSLPDPLVPTGTR